MTVTPDVPATSPLAGCTTPAGQVAAAMVGVGTYSTPGSTDGTRLTIAMAPPAIGMVTIQIDSAKSGSVVAIAATHPATLESLQNDHAALAQMLTQAGVPLEHRTIIFHLEPTRADPSLSLVQAGAGQTGAGQTGAGGFGQSGRPAGQPGGQPSMRPSPAYEQAERLDPVAAATLVQPISMRRFGVNMMA